MTNVREKIVKETSIRDYETRLIRVIEHIDAHLEGNLRLESLADIAHFSPYHFHRIFRGMTGETIAGYIRRRRLERAAHRLQSSSVSVTELAFDSGFESNESFARAFRSQFGSAPSNYRHTGTRMITRQGLAAARGSRLNVQAQALANYLQRKDRKVMFDVEIKAMPSIPLAFLRHKGSYHQIGPSFGTMCKEAEKQRLFGPRTQILARFYDDPNMVDVDNLRADAALVISADSDVAKPLKRGVIAAGDYAISILKGSYNELQAAYDWLFGQWLPESGREVANQPSVEIYLTNPDEVKPENNLTEIRIPLAP